ncbi:hypothetical protein [Corynebacterium epidermidicanis]|uniref:Uncharacterized protein n=1 Tax=Corynebacterium epidermidicanis TaxID=1050174 RepID=A0A0G3GM49_9CORY|nr:hypothetical protein [Corynebacterium epidermidicanis]AKK02301.1 hypothetical protein CEPID_02100 [Corynebacterium epidermidicanis]
MRLSHLKKVTVATGMAAVMVLGGVQPVQAASNTYYPADDTCEIRFTNRDNILGENYAFVWDGVRAALNRISDKKSFVSDVKRYRELSIKYNELSKQYQGKIPEELSSSLLAETIEINGRLVAAFEAAGYNQEGARVIALSTVTLYGRYQAMLQAGVELDAPARLDETEIYPDPIVAKFAESRFPRQELEDYLAKEGVDPGQVIDDYLSDIRSRVVSENPAIQAEWEAAVRTFYGADRGSAFEIDVFRACLNRQSLTVDTSKMDPSEYLPGFDLAPIGASRPTVTSKPSTTPSVSTSTSRPVVSTSEVPKPTSATQSPSATSTETAKPTATATPTKTAEPTVKPGETPKKKSNAGAIVGALVGVLGLFGLFGAIAMQFKHLLPPAIARFLP